MVYLRIMKLLICGFLDIFLDFWIAYGWVGGCLDIYISEVVGRFGSASLVAR